MYYNRFFVVLSVMLVSVCARGNFGVLGVDLQRDFLDLPGAALPVPGADEQYVKDVCSFLSFFREQKFLVFHTQDYHTGDNISFAKNCGNDTKGNRVQPFSVDEKDGRMKWPVHCVQGTIGAEIVVLDISDCVVPKGTNPLFDSYSGFQDDGGAKTMLRVLLQKQGIKHVVVFGLATNYCVKATVIDGAQDADYPIISHVVINFCRSVTAQDEPGTYASEIEALKAMCLRGARLYFIDIAEHRTVRIEVLLKALEDNICVVANQEELVAAVEKRVQEEATACIEKQAVDNIQ